MLSLFLVMFFKQNNIKSHCRNGSKSSERDAFEDRMAHGQWVTVINIFHFGEQLTLDNSSKVIYDWRSRLLNEPLRKFFLLCQNSIYVSLINHLCPISCSFINLTFILFKWKTYSHTHIYICVWECMYIITD